MSLFGVTRRHALVRMRTGESTHAADARVIARRERGIVARLSAAELPLYLGTFGDAAGEIPRANIDRALGAYRREAQPTGPPEERVPPRVLTV